MCESLDFARSVWKEFGLNNSKGAGMEYYENGALVKKYGAAIIHHSEDDYVVPVFPYRAPAACAGKRGGRK